MDLTDSLTTERLLWSLESCLQKQRAQRPIGFRLRVKLRSYTWLVLWVLLHRPPWLRLVNTLVSGWRWLPVQRESRHAVPLPWGGWRRAGLLAAVVVLLGFGGGVGCAGWGVGGAVVRG